LSTIEREVHIFLNKKWILTMTKELEPPKDFYFPPYLAPKVKKVETLTDVYYFIKEGSDSEEAIPVMRGVAGKVEGTSREHEPSDRRYLTPEEIVKRFIEGVRG